MGKPKNCDRCGKDITATEDKVWVSDVPKGWANADDDGNAVICHACAFSYEEIALADLAKPEPDQSTN